MRFGVMLGMGEGSGLAHPDHATEAILLAERLGYESVWAGEHVVIPDYTSRYPYAADGRLPQSSRTDVPDPLIWLAYAAALTERIGLATGVIVLHQRNPVVLAKQIATLDLLSRGRVTLGVGVGWMREEAEILGAPWETRGPRTEEYVAALRALWQQDRASYHGEHVSFDAARSYPKPARAGQTVPIVIGGSSLAAARRAGRLGDGYHPIAPTLDGLTLQIEAMRAAARAASRNPDEIEISTLAFALVGEDPVTPELIDSFRAMEAAGVSRIVIPRLLDADRDHAIHSLQRLADELLERYP
ncbi:MAG: LLM class F420-dependent oxidoreductase [Solirubrobacteraceae bacterium]